MWGVSVIKSVLARHMKIHDEVAQFRCEICDKRLKTKDYLSQHKKTHMKLEDIQCPSCQAERYWLMLETYENKLYCTK